MKKRLVTVIIAVHNNERYIQRCLDSVVGQTYSNLEIIVIDDGSTDTSLALCKQYEYDKRIKIISQKNSGLSSSRQTGLEHAHGKYLSFIDADDYIELDYIEKLYSGIVLHGADICVCGTNFVDKTGRIKLKETKAYSCLSNGETVKIDVPLLEYNYYGTTCKYYMCDSWNKMYSREFLTSSRIKFDMPKGLNGSDMVFNHRILLLCPKIATINNRLYNHVIYSNSAAHRKQKELVLSVDHIVSHLISDSINLNIFSNIKSGIFVFYIASLRDVMQDLYKEMNENELNEKLKYILSRYRGYKNKYHFLLNKTNVLSKSLKSYYYLLELGNVCLLKMYLHLRGKHI